MVDLLPLYVSMDFLPYGQLRDQLNRFPVGDPVNLMIGIPVCLNFILFKGRDHGTAPYPLAEEIVSWHWCADRDFDHSTDPLIVGDDARISATRGSTETRIRVPIADYSQALTEMLAGRAFVDGLIGELVGNNASGADVFCMQISSFTVHNRIT